MSVGLSREFLIDAGMKRIGMPLRSMRWVMSVSMSLTVILVIIGEFEELIELPPVVIASVDGLLLQPVAATAVVASMTTEVLPVKASILVTSAAFHFD